MRTFIDLLNERNLRQVRLFLILLILLASFIPLAPKVSTKSSMIEGVPYVWQRLDGLCGSASLTSILKYYGVDVDLDRVLDLSGAGWGMMYIRSDPNWFFSLSAFDYQSQIEDYKALVDAFGFELTYYSQFEVTPYPGVKNQTLSSWDDAWNLLTSKIDSSDPVLLSVDPAVLPPEQYDIYRFFSITGASHGVVAIGYNETKVKIIDPGIGIWDEHAHPSNGEGVYWVPLATFKEAWENRYFIAFTLSRIGEGKDLISATIERARDKLSPALNLTGVYPSIYNPSYGWSLGYEFYRDFAYDMQPENFKIMMTSWLNYLDDDVTSLITVVKSLPSGVVYVVSLSKQLLNYSATDFAKILNSLPNYKEDTVAELNSAISSLDPLTDDYLLNNPYPLVVERSKNTILDQTFNSFAKALEDGANISSAVDSIEHNLFALSSNLSTVSSHLKSAIEMFPYQLTVSSAYDSPKGSGWYDPGTNVTFSIETPVGFIVKQIFTNWSGDSNATTPKATIVMDDHHTVVAEWRNDYSQLMSYTRIYILAAILISVIIFYILLLYHYNYLK